jgi:CheY-like chemotaxis protein
MIGKPLVILLIEDNPDHAELILRNLKDHLEASKVYHLPDGAAALDYLYRCGEYASPEKSPHPDVILLDLRLPKIDGLEVLRKVKADEKLHAIPVVILTTSEAENDIAQAYENHANSYLVKPVDFDMFAQLMQDLGFYWLRWNRRPWEPLS